MKIYLAGVPGGNQLIGEKERLLGNGVFNRLVSFHYIEQLKITMEAYYENIFSR